MVVFLALYILPTRTLQNMKNNEKQESKIIMGKCQTPYLYCSIAFFPTYSFDAIIKVFLYVKN